MSAEGQARLEGLVGWAIPEGLLEEGAFALGSAGWGGATVWSGGKCIAGPGVAESLACSRSRRWQRAGTALWFPAVATNIP